MIFVSRVSPSAHVVNSTLTFDFAEMDTETFHVFWKLSEKGSPAEKCFIRTPQYEHYFEDHAHPVGLETMPDVGIFASPKHLFLIRLPIVQDHAQV